jgi:hypothetical protein
MGIDLMWKARAKTEKIDPHAVEGGTILVVEFMKGSFVAGLRDDRIKYIVKARGEEDSVETALKEESEVKSQKFKGNQGNLTWPNTGNSRNLRKEYRPQIKREVNMTSIQCFRGQGTGHLAKNNCRTRPKCRTCHKVGHETKDCRARKQGKRQ